MIFEKLSYDMITVSYGKTHFMCILLLFFSGVLFAQPNEAYINKLTGEVNSDWLHTVGRSAVSQAMIWKDRTIHGFIRNDTSARKQAHLDQPWNFYKIDPKNDSSEYEPVKFPHHFEEERNYTKGWYVTRFDLDELNGKQLFLMLNRVDLFAMVYVNGKRIGHHFGSYTPFEFDISDASIPGQNVLAIFVQDRSAAVDNDKAYNQLGPEWLKSAYSQGRTDEILKGGIDDAPILEIREHNHVKDVFVKTSTRKNEMEIDYELTSNGSSSSGTVLSFDLYKWPEGKRVDLEIPDVKIDSFDKLVHSLRVKWSNPDLWSPDHPNLYVLRTTLHKTGQKDVVETRFGFREFWVDGKMFMLNGVPTRLRGESTFRSLGSGIESHKKNFELHKNLFGSNACRIHAYMPHGEIIQAADEVGVLLINQSAIWSVNVMFYKNGGDWFLKNTEKEFEEWARRDRNCPSVVIWDVENEMLRYNYTLHLPWVSKLPGFIQKYDDTRPFNFSGGGWFSEDQDMASLHMQEHYTHIMKDWVKKGTSPLLMGEFWVGGRMEQRLPTSPELVSLHQRYHEEARIYEDKLLEMRYLGVTGIMPFRISLLSFSREQRSSDSELIMRSADITNKIKHGMQPVSLFFWPRQKYVKANDTIQRELVVCNDSETSNLIQISWRAGNGSEKNKTLRIEPGKQQRIKVSELSTDTRQNLMATAKIGEELVSADTLEIHPIALSEVTLNKTILVYKDENFFRKLIDLGFTVELISTIPKSNEEQILVIPEHSDNRDLNAKKEEILSFLKDGGNILCLKQSEAPLWFPTKFQFWSAYQTSPHTYAKMGWEGLHKNLFYATTAPVLAPSHPVFSGQSNASLHLWDTYDGRVSDDVFVRPASVGIYEQGNWRPLVSGTRREHVSLAELFLGKGILLSCQLNVTENLDNIQARNMLFNMLNYLSGSHTERFMKKIALTGAVSAKDFASKTGVSSESLHGAKAKNKDLMLAFEGGSVSDILDWANRGGTVLVFSDSISNTFKGIKTQKTAGASYLATKITDHPMLRGVSSANFINADPAIIAGYFEEIPDQATVLLQGYTGTNFWRIKEAGPVMISVTQGKGEIVLSTIEMKEKPGALFQELLALILTNRGVEIPYLKHRTNAEITIKKTVPIKVDGVLNEWLEDMEDRFVTPYIHAQPVYLTSENIVKGPPQFDLNLSAINYFLWNEKALHIAGVVFSEEKTYETGIDYGAEKEYVQQIKYNDDIINISVKNNKAEVQVNGQSVSGEFVKTGSINSTEMTDATNLRFNYILASGKITSIDSLEGETFELMIPWGLLTSTPSDQLSKGVISIESKASKLQLPQSDLTDSKENWLQLRLNQNGK